MFEVIILGSGSCIPSSKRGYPGMIIYHNDSRPILLDAGSGTLNRMVHLDIDYKELDKVLLTHLHPDHSTDLITLLLALNYTPGYNRNKVLEVYGPAGSGDFISGLQRIYPSLIPAGYPLSVTELSDSAEDLGAIKMISRTVEHAEIPSIAFRLEDGEDSLVISGDTGFCAGIIEISKNADLLILESSFPIEKFSNSSHLTAAEAGRIAKVSKAGTLAVKHLYPVCDGYNMKELIAGEFDGNIILSEDYMRLRLSKGETTVLT
jgi:ribonuclease BN (tRNA processing enzyme)